MTGTRAALVMGPTAFAAGLVFLAWLPSAAHAQAWESLPSIDTSAFEAPEWSVDRQPDRLVLACEACDELTAIDVRVARVADDSETESREGRITAQSLFAECEANARHTEAACYDLRPVDLKGAVGFVSDVRIFEGVYSNTYSLYQDGRVIVMRGVGDSRDEARRVGDLAYRHIAPQIVR